MTARHSGDFKCSLPSDLISNLSAHATVMCMNVGITRIVDKQILNSQYASATSLLIWRAKVAVKVGRNKTDWMTWLRSFRNHLPKQNGSKANEIRRSKDIALHKVETPSRYPEDSRIHYSGFMFLLVISEPAI
jgi:hypothetical protein